MTSQILTISTDNQHAFWFNNGYIAHGLKDLVKGLETCTAETFAYHVNSQKNDFANWIHDIMGDEALSKRLAGCLDKKRYLIKIKRRITELEKSAVV